MPHVQFRLLDLDSRPYDVGTTELDTVICMNVLEHIEDDVAALRALGAVLRPGGRLILQVPNYPRLFGSLDRSYGHFRRYSKGSLLAAAPPSLAPVEAFYLDAAGMALSLANRMLLRASMPTGGQILFWDRVVVPMSRLIDPVLARSVGKSVVAIWTVTHAPGNAA